MKQDADGKYAQPSFADPGLERWAQPEPPAEGKETDDSGWQQKKVMRDIRETAKSDKFTSAQVEESHSRTLSGPRRGVQTDGGARPGAR